MCRADGRGGRCEQCGRSGGGRRPRGRCRDWSDTAGSGGVWLGRSGGRWWPIVAGCGVIGVGFSVGVVTTPLGRLMGRGGFFWLELPCLPGGYAGMLQA